jgi:hypothetical protein
VQYARALASVCRFKDMDAPVPVMTGEVGTKPFGTQFTRTGAYLFKDHDYEYHIEIS